MNERAPIAPEMLYPRRLAWRALELVLDQYNLRAMALKLNPDDPTQALPGVERGEVSFYEDFAGGRGQVIATVLLDGTAARVLVPRIERLIRRNHLRDFRPAEVGISQVRDSFDVDQTVPLAEVVEVHGAAMRTAKQRVLAPGTGPRRPVDVVRAFGGRG